MKARLTLMTLEYDDIKTERKTLQLPRPVKVEQSYIVSINKTDFNNLTNFLFQINGKLMTSGYQVGLESEEEFKTQGKE